MFCPELLYKVIGSKRQISFKTCVEARIQQKKVVEIFPKI
jgi:hypothetical protein